jgi:hypothetical protein
MARWFLLLFVTFLVGCFGAEALSQVSAGYIGCSANEIEITNDQPGFNQRSWDASCRGRTYHCSGVSRGGLACSEDRPSPLSVGAVAASPSIARPPPRSWKRFSATDCGITILLPGEPEEQRETVKTKAGPIKAYSGVVDVGSGTVFVGCAQTPRSVLGLEKTLDAARDGSLEQMGGALESEHDVAVGDFKGREVRFLVHGEHGRLRILRHGGQIVTMGVVPNKAFASAETVKFFETIDIAHETGSE